MKLLLLFSLLQFMSCNPFQTKTLVGEDFLQANISITTLTPLSGSLQGGTRLTLTGINFKAGATIEVGGLNCTGVTFISTNTLECTSPAHAIATVDVKVTNPNGKSDTKENAFSYITEVTASAGSAITLGGGIISDADVQMHGYIGEAVSGGPVFSNSEATMVSGLEGALSNP